MRKRKHHAQSTGSLRSSRRVYFRWLAVCSLCQLLVALTVCAADDVTLRWQAPETNADGSPLTDLSHYNLYYGPAQGSLSGVVENIVSPQYTLEGLEPGTYYVAVTALDRSQNESALSDLLTVEVDAQPLPGDMNLDGRVDFSDIAAFSLGLTSKKEYQQVYGVSPSTYGDLNGDGRFDFDDIAPFVALIM